MEVDSSKVPGENLGRIADVAAGLDHGPAGRKEVLAHVLQPLARAACRSSALA